MLNKIKLVAEHNPINEYTLLALYINGKRIGQVRWNHRISCWVAYRYKDGRIVNAHTRLDAIMSFYSYKNTDKLKQAEDDVNKQMLDI